MIFDVVGNGKSRELYSRSENFSIGCNFARNVEVDATCVIDAHVVDKMHNQRYIPPPIICPNFMRKKIKGYVSDRYPFKIHDLIVRVSGKEYSSGHHAVYYAVAQGATEINLYGFDSFTDENVDSDTHLLWDNVYSRSRWQSWRKIWLEYFEKYSGIKFNIFGYGDLNYEVPDNVTYNKVKQ